MASVEHDTSKAMARMNAAMRRVPESANAAREVIAANAERACKQRYVPVLDGILRNTITGRALPDGKTVELRSNGIVYAKVQNFDESLDHNTPENDTGERGAHYIERGLAAGIDESRPAVQAMGKQNWRRG